MLLTSGQTCGGRSQLLVNSRTPCRERWKSGRTERLKAQGPAAGGADLGETFFDGTRPELRCLACRREIDDLRPCDWCRGPMCHDCYDSDRWLGLCPVCCPDWLAPDVDLDIKLRTGERGIDGSEVEGCGIGQQPLPPPCPLQARGSPAGGVPVMTTACQSGPGQGRHAPKKLVIH